MKEILSVRDSRKNETINPSFRNQTKYQREKEALETDHYSSSLEPDNLWSVENHLASVVLKIDIYYRSQNIHFYLYQVRENGYYQLHFGMISNICRSVICLNRAFKGQCWPSHGVTHTHNIFWYKKSMIITPNLNKR